MTYLGERLKLIEVDIPLMHTTAIMSTTKADSAVTYETDLSGLGQTNPLLIFRILRQPTQAAMEAANSFSAKEAKAEQG